MIRMMMMIKIIRMIMMKIMRMIMAMKINDLDVLLHLLLHHHPYPFLM